MALTSSLSWSPGIPKTWVRTRWQPLLIVSLMGVYIGVFSVFTIVRYDRYNATGWDLGVYTNLVWNAGQGRPMHNTVAEVDNFLGVHATYMTILLAPFLWLWNDPRIMLIAQSVGLAPGAWPISRLVRRHFNQPWIPPLFALGWLLYPALGWINRFDFHPEALVVLFLACAFEAADRRSWTQTTFWLVLSVLCKEEMGLMAAFFGVYMVLRFNRPKRIGVIWFILGIGWFLIHAFVVFPAVRDATNGLPIHAIRYTWLLSGNMNAMCAYITGPDTLLKIGFLVKLLAPLAFVPLLAPVPLIVALPTLVLSLLSAFEPQFDIYRHYTIEYIPVLFVAAIYGLKRLQAILERHPSSLVNLRRAGALIVTCCVVIWIIYNPLLTPPPATETIYGWEPGAHVAALDEVQHLIPADTCIASSNNIEPHYSTRRLNYVIGQRGDIDGCEYMVVDLSDQRFHTFTDDTAVACPRLRSCHLDNSNQSIIVTLMNTQRFVLPVSQEQQTVTGVGYDAGGRHLLL